MIEPVAMNMLFSGRHDQSDRHDQTGRREQTVRYEHTDRMDEQQGRGDRIALCLGTSTFYESLFQVLGSPCLHTTL